MFWKRLYKTSSSMEKGILFQLRNLLDRRNVSKTPKSDVYAYEDFLETVVIGHILAAAMKYLGMSSMNDQPSSSIISQDVWMEDDEERKRILHDISSAIVDLHVDLATVFKSDERAQEGTAYDYACEVISLGLLYLDIQDLVREGDGDRDMLDWKYLMLVYKASGRRNYAIEALTLLTQYHIVLPPNLAAQLKWSRFVNVSGLPGCNVSCDLHNEHLNREVKTAIAGLGANKGTKAIIKVGKALGALHKATASFNRDVGAKVSSGKHPKKSMSRDISIVTQQLMETDVFNPQTNNVHISFRTLKTNLIKTLDEKSLKEWMAERFSLVLCPQTTTVEEPSDDDYEDTEDE